MLRIFVRPDSDESVLKMHDAVRTHCLWWHKWRDNEVLSCHNQKVGSTGVFAKRTAQGALMFLVFVNDNKCKIRIQCKKDVISTNRQHHRLGGSCGTERAACIEDQVSFGKTAGKKQQARYRLTKFNNKLHPCMLFAPIEQWYVSNNEGGFHWRWAWIPVFSLLPLDSVNFCHFGGFRWIPRNLASTF